MSLCRCCESHPRWRRRGRVHIEELLGRRPGGDVLEKHFNSRARWTEAIQREAGRLGLPALDWPGPAMSAGEDIEALIGVNEIRRGLGATRADPATLHLARRRAFMCLRDTRYHPDWTFVSDDQPAIDFARPWRPAVNTYSYAAKRGASCSQSGWAARSSSHGAGAGK